MQHFERRSRPSSQCAGQHLWKRVNRRHQSCIFTVVHSCWDRADNEMCSDYTHGAYRKGRAEVHICLVYSELDVEGDTEIRCTGDFPHLEIYTSPSSELQGLPRQHHTHAPPSHFDAATSETRTTPAQATFQLFTEPQFLPHTPFQHWCIQSCRHHWAKTLVCDAAHEGRRIHWDISLQTLHPLKTASSRQPPT